MTHSWQIVTTLMLVAVSVYALNSRRHLRSVNKALLSKIDQQNVTLAKLESELAWLSKSSVNVGHRLIKLEKVFFNTQAHLDEMVKDVIDEELSDIKQSTHTPLSGYDPSIEAMSPEPHEEQVGEWENYVDSYSASQYQQISEFVKSRKEQAPDTDIDQPSLAEKELMSLIKKKKGHSIV